MERKSIFQDSIEEVQHCLSTQLSSTSTDTHDWERLVGIVELNVSPSHTTTDYVEAYKNHVTGNS